MMMLMLKLSLNCLTIFVFLGTSNFVAGLANIRSTKLFSSSKLAPHFMSNGDSDKISKSWDLHFEKKRETRYQIITAPGLESFGQSIVDLYPERFLAHSTSWGKFPDGTDNIEIGGFSPVNKISGQNVLMLASFHNNDVTLSQFSVMITLLQSFVESLTVVLSYYPVGTMERVTKEGQVATANTYAQMFSNLPSSVVNSPVQQQILCSVQEIIPHHVPT